MILEPGPIAEEFDEAALVAAIRDATGGYGTIPGIRQALDGGRHHRLLGPFLPAGASFISAARAQQHIEEFPKT